MFPQFGATAESISKASSLVLRIGTDAHLYDDPDDVNIAPLLDSRFDSEKVEALKRLLALIAQGADVSHFYPQVVKNVASHSLEVKKLVYLYLLHYAEKRQNEALLSVNCFQKDLSDTNPLVRAWALRAMAGIHLHVVAPLVLVAVGKCARDPSAYVRKCAAHALPKLCDLLTEENVSALVEIVDILLGDNSPGVVGASAAAFKSVCPSSLFFIKKHFRRLCETLPDVDEWGQIVLIEIILRYIVARHGLDKGSIMFTSDAELVSQTDKSLLANHQSNLAGDFKMNTLMYRCYVGEGDYLSRDDRVNGDDDNLEFPIITFSTNDDVKLLLQCTSPLLWSHNSAVVLAAATVHWIMSTKEEVKRIVKPLLFILRSSKVSKYVILCNVLIFAKAAPSFFAPYVEDFFVCGSDSYQIRSLKLEILSIIATESTIPIILEEFQEYMKDPNRKFVADTVAAIGLCAQRIYNISSSCLEGLLALVLQESSITTIFHIDGEADVLVQAIMSIKGIIKQDPISHEKVIIRLVRILDKVKEPAARALIIWIAGEYNDIGQAIPKIIPSLLKYLTWSFTSEEVETKLQILNTAVKVVLSRQGEDLSTIRKMFSYIIELARYDLNYDLRDRARLLLKLVPSEEDVACQLKTTVICNQLAETIFIGGTHSKTTSARNFQIYLPGSLSQVVLHAAPGYVCLPKPCSLVDSDLHFQTKLGNDMTKHATGAGMNDNFETDDPDVSSGSSIEESGSYDTEHSGSNLESETGSACNSDDNDHAPLKFIQGTQDNSEHALVHVSDDVQGSLTSEKSLSTYISTDLAELMSKSAFESWLDEHPGSASVQTSRTPSGRISINDLNCTIVPKLHTLLDPANGNGLKVEYAFSSEISTASPVLVCIQVLFENLSSDPLLNVSLKNGEPNTLESPNQVLEEPESHLQADSIPSILSFEEIASLDPGQRVKKVIQVHFRHHLLPLKLFVHCNGKKILTKLWPDIGYFLKPLSMNMQVFVDKERQLPGMFEYSKKCSFKDHIDKADSKEDNSIHTDKTITISRSLAAKMLSNSNVYLVSVDIPVSFNINDASGLCLRFSGEILSSSKPCLITVTAEGKFCEPLDLTVKINCEETVFGLNLLNRVATFLQ